MAAEKGSEMGVTHKAITTKGKHAKYAGETKGYVADRGKGGGKHHGGHKRGGHK